MLSVFLSPGWSIPMRRVLSVNKVINVPVQNDWTVLRLENECKTCAANLFPFYDLCWDYYGLYKGYEKESWLTGEIRLMRSETDGIRPDDGSGADWSSSSDMRNESLKVKLMINNCLNTGEDLCNQDKFSNFRKLSETFKLPNYNLCNPFRLDTVLFRFIHIQSPCLKSF